MLTCAPPLIRNPHPCEVSLLLSSTFTTAPSGASPAAAISPDFLSTIQLQCNTATLQLRSEIYLCHTKYTNKSKLHVSFVSIASYYLDLFPLLLFSRLFTYTICTSINSNYSCVKFHCMPVMFHSINFYANIEIIPFKWRIFRLFFLQLTKSYSH